MIVTLLIAHILVMKKPLIMRTRRGMVATLLSNQCIIIGQDTPRMIGRTIPHLLVTTAGPQAIMECIHNITWIEEDLPGAMKITTLLLIVKVTDPQRLHMNITTEVIHHHLIIKDSHIHIKPQMEKSYLKENVHGRTTLNSNIS